MRTGQKVSLCGIMKHSNILRSYGCFLTAPFLIPTQVLGNNLLRKISV